MMQGNKEDTDSVIFYWSVKGLEILTVGDETHQFIMFGDVRKWRVEVNNNKLKRYFLSYKKLKRQ